MRVLLSPRARMLVAGPMVAEALAAARPDAGMPGAVADTAIVAGTDGSGWDIVPLFEAGVHNLGRTLSAAEIYAVRKALLGVDPGRVAASGVPRDVIVGYVCVGRQVESGPGSEARAVAVVDHANLTWRSPLEGPNDERLGPRFPAMGRVYVPALVTDQLAGLSRIHVEAGIVGGVTDDSWPSGFERKIASAQRYAAMSSELTSVTILAAHLGWRVAAAVIVDRLQEGDAE